MTLHLPFKLFCFFPNYFKYETPKIIFIYYFSTVCNTSHTHIQECIYFFDCVYLSKLLFLQKVCVVFVCGQVLDGVLSYEEECVLVWRWGVLLMFERRSGGWL